MAKKIHFIADPRRDSRKLIPTYFSLCLRWIHENYTTLAEKYVTCEVCLDKLNKRPNIG